MKSDQDLLEDLRAALAVSAAVPPYKVANTDAPPPLRWRVSDGDGVIMVVTTTRALADALKELFDSMPEVG